MDGSNESASLRIMAVQEFVAVTRAIQYDGTNSAEIIAYFGEIDPTVSEIDGVWEVTHEAYGPTTVYVGDWYYVNGWFCPDAEFSPIYVSVESLPHP